MRGREQEWQAIGDLLDRAKRGQSGMLLVEGKPGLGKSLLLAEAVSAADRSGFVTAAAAADELTRYMPAGPMLAALGQPPHHARPEPGQPGTGPMPLVEDLGRRLEDCAQSGPVLVCLDDLQWADTGTLLALRLLPPQLASYPMAWLLARSDLHRGSRAEMLFDLLAPEGAARIELAPLGDDAVTAVVADTLGWEPDQALLELAAGAAGNPALITDLITGLIDEHALTVRAGRARLSSDILPRRMQASVHGSVGRLSTRARQLVETAAILGRSFRLEDAAAMLGTSAADLLPPVEEALAAEVLVPTKDALNFRHELLWRATLDSLAPPVRQALHGQFGDLLLARGSAFQAAPHLIEAAHANDPQTLGRLDHVRASVLATSPEAAADVAVRALSLTPADDPERIARSAGAAEALAAADRLGEADQVIRNVLELPMSGRQRARLRGALASVLHLRGLDVQASDEADRALGEPGLPRSVRGLATIALLQALAAVCDRKRGGELAACIADAPGDYGRDVRVTALIALAVMWWDEGRMRESLDLCEDAVLLAGRKPADLRLGEAQLALASRLIDIGKFTEAATLLKLARERPGMLNGLDVSASPALLRARIGLAQGRLDDAVAEVETARKVADARGAHAYRGYAFQVLATVALRSGDLGMAAELEPGPACQDDLAASCGHIGQGITAAQLAEARAGPDAAMPLLSWIYDAIAEHCSPLISEPATISWLIRVALATGRAQLAERVAGTAGRIARANPGFPTVIAAADHAAGILTGDRARLARACDGYEDPWLGASAAEDLGTLVASQGGSQSDSVAHLDDAIAGYARSGAVRDVARVRRRLRRLGVRRRHWAAHRGPEIGWDSLTDTERAISELVSRGLSNQEVADRKYVSVHTVAFHLRQVFRKLGISSRVELARIAVENATERAAADGASARHPSRTGAPQGESWSTSGST
jgi:DNA-binding CsgD family transcriptional regulator/tetratricopeptide (TPR) repeat protein